MTFFIQMEAFVKEILCRFDFFRLFRLDLPIYNSLFFSLRYGDCFLQYLRENSPRENSSASLLFNFFLSRSRRWRV